MSTDADREKDQRATEAPNIAAAQKEGDALFSAAPPAHPVGPAPPLLAQPYWHHPHQYYPWGPVAAAAPRAAAATGTLPALPALPALPFAPNLPAPTPEEFQRVMLYAHMQQQQQQQQQQLSGQMPAGFPGYPYFGFHPGMMGGAPAGLARGAEGLASSAQETHSTRTAASK
jgi:hypothetical protein